jgi:hypothetical protein
MSRGQKKKKEKKKTTKKTKKKQKRALCKDLPGTFDDPTAPFWPVLQPPYRLGQKTRYEAIFSFSFLFCFFFFFFVSLFSPECTSSFRTESPRVTGGS